MRNTLLFVAVTAACAGSALADPMGLWALPVASGLTNFNGPTSIPGTQPVAYAALGSSYLFAPNTTNGDGFSYSWSGADYSTNFTISYTISTSATSTTITGLMTLTNQLSNATSTPASISSMVSFTLPIEIYQAATFTSIYWSPTGNPPLATAAYACGGSFCNPAGYSPVTAVPGFGTSGSAAAGQYGFGGTISNDLWVTGADVGPQTVSLNFQITVTVPSPGAAAFAGLGFAGLVIRRRR